MSEAAPQSIWWRVFQRLNANIRRVTDRYLNLWSVLTLASVAAILLICIALWDVVSLRPVLATIGAGLAAFLGPIPGIISPEIRAKWLVTIGVSALIAAGTWFATQDLANHLQASEDEVHTLNERIASQNDGVVDLLKAASPDALDAVFIASSGVMRARHKAKKPEEVLDLAIPLWRLRPENGTALAFAGYASRALGRFDDAKKYFENYIALAPTVEASSLGAQKVCNERADGYCAERTGWIYHLRATMALREAAQAEGAQRLKLLQEALDREASNVALIKWNRPDKLDQGFNAEEEEPLSSCDVLESVATQLKAMGKPWKPVAELRAAKLKCG
jgi:tetratricopeptide (TPR) repeat protein